MNAMIAVQILCCVVVFESCCRCNDVNDVEFENKHLLLSSARTLVPRHRDYEQQEASWSPLPASAGPRTSLSEYSCHIDFFRCFRFRLVPISPCENVKHSYIDLLGRLVESAFANRDNVLRIERFAYELLNTGRPSVGKMRMTSNRTTNHLQL